MAVAMHGLQYRALYEYKKDREEDLALAPGDLLTVSKAGLLGMDSKEGEERSPQGWLNGFNEQTKEWGDFPGTYVEYLGPVRIVASTSRARPRPLLPTPSGMPTCHPWETQTIEQCGQQIKLILESPCLPQWHRRLLQHLTRHFCKLCQNVNKNHPTPRLLEEAFSEVLFRPSLSSMEVNPEYHVKIIEALIVAGGVSEIQAAPDSLDNVLTDKKWFS